MSGQASIQPQTKQYLPDLSPERLDGSTLCVQYSPRHIRIGAYSQEGFLFGEEYNCADLTGNAKCQAEPVLQGHALIQDLSRFAEVRLLLQTGHFAWIPAAYFNPDMGLDYLGLTASLDQKQYVACQSNLGEIVNLFAFPKQELQFWQKKELPSLRIFHYADVQYHYINRMEEKPGRVIQVLLEDQWAGIMVSDGNSPVLANAVTFATEEEISNFTRHVAEACQFDFLRDAVLLQGQIVRESAIFKRLFPYFAKLQFSSGLAPDATRGVFENLDPHRFFDLLALPGLE